LHYKELHEQEINKNKEPWTQFFIEKKLTKKTMNKTMYKLTDKNMTTFGGTKWELNQWKETSGEGGLCRNGWLHCYSDPLLAIFFNSMHANITHPRLFEVEVDGKEKLDYGLKFGYSRMRLVKEIEVPKLTKEQAIKFGLLCALEVYKDYEFAEWAKKILNGESGAKYPLTGSFSAPYYPAPIVRQAHNSAWAVVSQAHNSAWAIVTAIANNNDALIIIGVLSAAQVRELDLVKLVKLAVENGDMGNGNNR